MLKPDDTSDDADRRSRGQPAFGRQNVSRVGPSIVIRGELVARDEELEIFGRVEGVIEHDQSLVIRRGGVVQATVIAEDIRVEGSLEGDAFARQRVHLAAGASARGNLLTPAFSVEEGATLQGHVDMEAGGDTVEARFRQSAGRERTDDVTKQAPPVVPESADAAVAADSPMPQQPPMSTGEGTDGQVPTGSDSWDNTVQEPEDAEEAAGKDIGKTG